MFLNLKYSADFLHSQEPLKFLPMSHTSPPARPFLVVILKHTHSAYTHIQKVMIVMNNNAQVWKTCKYILR